MKRIGSFLQGVLALVAICGGTNIVMADKVKRHDAPQALDVDQNEALAPLHRKEFKPLSEVLAAGQKAIPGEVVRVRLKRVRGEIAYELKIISEQGKVREIYIDPLTLNPLKVE